MKRSRAPYADRIAAGRALAAQLTAYEGNATDVLVLGLPRGGVPVAAVVAAELGASLDVLVVRKLGLPHYPELAMGAIAGVGDTVELVRNEPVLARAPVTMDAFDAVYQREVTELRRRMTAYRGGRPPVPIDGRVVIVVDDGLATGSTMRAAVAAVRRQQPARLVVAVPIASRTACAELGKEVDDVVCTWTPEPFHAVGQGYRDFSPTSDDEVRRALAAAGRPAGRKGTGGA